MKYKLLGNNIKINFIQEVLKNRGIDNYQEFLYSKEECLNDSSNLDNIDIGCELLYNHIYNNNKILLVVDCDADGMTSSAMLYNFIKKIQPDTNINYALHNGKMHGLSNDLCMENEKTIYDYDLVILPDASSNDYEQHYELRTRGIDVLVIDHHETPQGYSANACVINNQLSKNYTNKSLSGAGVVWQFIRHYINKYNLTDININYFLDLLTVGNVADVMDMSSLETKYLCSLGKNNLNNAGILALCKKQEYSMKGEFNPMSIGWYIGPLINAVLRVGTIEEKDLLFRSLLDENKNIKIQSTKRGAKQGDLELLVNEAARIASNVRNRQNKMVDKGMELIEKLIEENNLLENKILLVEIDENDIEPEIVGLVANKIASKYMMPTLILRNVDNLLTGSGRNFENSPLEDMRGFLEASGVMELVQGHGSAFGASIKKENKDKLIDYCNEKLKDIIFEAILSVDFIFDLSKSTDKELLKQCCFELNKYKDIWGQGVHEPLILCKNVDISKIQLMAKGTFKIACGDIALMKFFAEDMYNEIKEKNKNIDVIGRLNVNEWAGRKTAQVFIDNYDFSKEEQKKWIF